MKSNTNLAVRVNGIAVASMKVRRELRNGEDTGKQEVVIQDPILGWLPIDNDNEIQVKDFNSGEGFRTVSVEVLYDLLCIAGAVPGAKPLSRPLAESLEDVSPLSEVAERRPCQCATCQLIRLERAGIFPQYVSKRRVRSAVNTLRMILPCEKTA